ncbi:MAG: NUDIX domain-containing protein [Candidatus Promineifilaceae bacterium]
MVEPLANTPAENRWRDQKQPAPVVISIIRRVEPGDEDGEEVVSYLLIKRKSGPYRDFWALVGGKWDFGESLSTAAIREIREETGLIGTFDALLGLVNERVTLDDGGELGAAHFLIFVCQVDARTGVAREQEEGAVAWFTDGDVEKLNAAGDIIPSDYAMLSQFIGGGALPYVEVEMQSVGARGERPGSTRLTRFEPKG